MLIITRHQTEEVFFSGSKYKRAWSPHHRSFSQLIATNLRATLTEVKSIQKKSQASWKMKKHLPLRRLYKSERQTPRVDLQTSCPEKFEKILRKIQL